MKPDPRAISKAPPSRPQVSTSPPQSTHAHTATSRNSKPKKDAILISQFKPHTTTRLWLPTMKSEIWRHHGFPRKDFTSLLFLSQGYKKAVIGGATEMKMFHSAGFVS